MILANLTKALRTQNWFAVTLEFLIVIAGVVIGFQITAWNEDRAEREAAEDYVERLQEELLFNRTQMDTQTVYANWVRTHIIATLDALQSDDSALGMEFIVDAYIAGHGVGAPIQTEALTELISTGAYRSIPDVEVQQQVLRFYQTTQYAEGILTTVSEYQSALRRNMPHDIINQLRQSCAAEFVTNQQGQPEFAIRDTCPPELPDQIVADAISELTAADLVPELREALALAEVKSNNIVRVRAAADDALAALERLE